MPVPGNPVGAVLCRYAGVGQRQPVGALAGAAKLTTSLQVAQLQSAMNASKALAGTVMGCFQSNGDAAIVIIIYPAGTPDRTVTFVPACLALVEGSTEYQVSGSFVQLLVDRTGDWKQVARNSSSERLAH